MLELPLEYIRALEEVLNQSLSENALRERGGRAFIESIARNVQTISRGLTKDRTAFVASRYLDDPAIQLAYLTYYTTTNVLKIWPPLRELAQGGFFQEKTSIRHLDLGSGTGAAVWGLATYLSKEQPSVERLDTVATDKLRKNLAAMTRFHSATLRQCSRPGHRLHCTLWDITRSAPDEVKGEEKYELITMMNVLNEVDESVDAMLIDTLRSLLADGGAVIMIEPSTREQSRRALRFRDRMVEQGMHIYAPCTRKGNCPALIEEDDWCHTEVRWQRPGFIRAIDDLAGTLRLSLKSTYAVALSEDRNLADVRIGTRDFLSAGRIVSDVADEKGRVRMTICNDRGKPEYVLNKRDKSQTNDAARSAKRYDLVTIEPIEIREHDVKIGGETVLNIESGPDGCGYVDN